jgi:hypothetical protein
MASSPQKWLEKLLGIRKPGFTKPYSRHFLIELSGITSLRIVENEKEPVTETWIKAQRVILLKSFETTR